MFVFIHLVRLGCQQQFLRVLVPSHTLYDRPTVDIVIGGNLLDQRLNLVVEPCLLLNAGIWVVQFRLHGTQFLVCGLIFLHPSTQIRAYNRL